MRLQEKYQEVVSLFASEYGAEEVDFLLAVGLAVGAKDFVKPDCGLAVGVGVFPGIPRQVGLRFARHETPVDSGDVVAFGDW
jgi:hypothetical protein